MTSSSSDSSDSSVADSGAAPHDAGVVAVGRVGKAHGVRGAVFVEPWTDAPEERFVPGARFTTEPPELGPLDVASARDHSGKLVVQFVGVDDRNAAERLRGARLTMPAGERPALEDPDEFYDTDLLGLRVRTVDGAELGVVDDVLHSPGGSILSVGSLLGSDEREILIPFRKAIVPVVDIAAGLIEVDPPEGLLEL